MSERECFNDRLKGREQKNNVFFFFIVKLI